MADVAVVWSWWSRLLRAWRTTATRQVATMRHGVRRRRRALLRWAAQSRTTLLALNGFGFLAASAWVTFGLGAGLAAIGTASLVLEVLSD